jgi:hypothetical protein
MFYCSIILKYKFPNLFKAVDLYAVQKSKNHCDVKDLSVTVISNNEKCVLFVPQWFSDF